jgi:hypothetical protein
MDFIWKIAMESPDEEIANEAIQLIINYSYINLNPRLKKVSIQGKKLLILRNMENKCIFLLISCNPQHAPKLVYFILIFVLNNDEKQMPKPHLNFHVSPTFRIQCLYIRMLFLF